MGEALIRGFLAKGLVAASELVGVELVAPRAKEMAEKYKIPVLGSVSEACREAGVVVLAVKPQDADRALAEIGGSIRGALLLSVCAGISLARLAQRLPGGTPVVRAMSNTPALIGCGASVYCAGESVSAGDRNTVDGLLGAVGEVYSVDKETLLDAVTGLSGSGPAYVFAFLEALADGGVLMGLPRQLARALACQTLIGSACLARESGEHTAELKDRVASPGGTTIAGLRELEARGFRGAVIEAVRVATARSRELGE